MGTIIAQDPRTKCIEVTAPLCATMARTTTAVGCPPHITQTICFLATLSSRRSWLSASPLDTRDHLPRRAGRFTYRYTTIDWVSSTVSFAPPHNIFYLSGVARGNAMHGEPGHSGETRRLSPSWADSGSISTICKSRGRIEAVVVRTEAETPASGRLCSVCFLVKLGGSSCELPVPFSRSSTNLASASPIAQPLHLRTPHRQ